MTPLPAVYNAFLAKILEDEWEYWTRDQIERDLYEILEGAITWFKFPRVSLEHTTTEFTHDLGNDEIQILAAFMKCEWLNRTILTWENVKPLYDERDFSQANLIDKFKQMLEKEESKARKLEAKYYRSINYKPFHYRDLATRIE